MQNAEGGGSIAILKDAYERIGGMDEGFVGWGGEDNEFWERAQTLRLWPYAHLPLWHLWHPPQPGKYAQDNATLHRYREMSESPVEERIRRLKGNPGGKLSGPTALQGAQAS